MLACWTLPMPATPGSFSQKQPPACESSQKFAASPDQLCSADHHLSGVRSIAHTSSGAAATCAVWATVKPMSRSDEHTSELQSLVRISYAVICLKNNIHVLIIV